MARKDLALVAFKYLDDARVKLYVLDKKDSSNIKLGQVIQAITDEKREKLKGLLEITDNADDNKVFVIQIDLENVIIMNSLGKFKKLTLESWKASLQDHKYIPVNSVDIYGNNLTESYEIGVSKILKEQSGSLVGVVQTEVRDSVVLYDVFKASKMPNNTYRLDAYIINSGKYIYIPKFIGVVDERQSFLNSDEIKKTLGISSNDLQHIEEIHTEKGSVLTEWQNRQFRGQDIFLLDFSSQRNLQVIGENAFSSCEQLNEVEISTDEPLVKLCDDAFNGAIKLQKFDLTSIKYLGDRQLKNQASLNDIGQTSHIRHIGQYAFSGQGIGGQLTFQGLDGLKTGQISDCDNLEQLFIYTNKNIESKQIANNSRLKTVKISREQSTDFTRLVVFEKDAIYNNKTLNVLIVPEYSELCEHFVYKSDNLMFIGNYIDKYYRQTVLLGHVKLHSAQFSELLNIKRIWLSNVIDELPVDFVENLWILYNIRIDDTDYEQQPEQNPRLWMQLKFAQDQGYKEDKSLHRQEDTIRFLHSRVNPYVMLCKFKRRPITQSIFVIHDRSTGKSRAIQVADKEWTNLTNLIVFQKELQFPKIKFI